MHAKIAESEQHRQALSTCKAALYVRLPKEDGNKYESNSIVSQELICKGWFYHLIHI